MTLFSGMAPKVAKKASILLVDGHAIKLNLRFDSGSELIKPLTFSYEISPENLDDVNLITEILNWVESVAKKAQHSLALMVKAVDFVKTIQGELTQRGYKVRIARSPERE